jgi:Protein of unknown function (DUF2971)
MILDRLYRPTENELIYHYCRPEAFLEIVNSRSIWLSASYTLNDVTERSWGYSTFAKAAKTLEREVGSEFINKIAEPVIAGDSHSILMIACFSLDVDVLSQWRAYADDGRGFAIGFSPKLMQIPAKPLRVLYDEDAQMHELIGSLKHTYEVEKSTGFKYGDEFQNHLFQMGLDLCAYKNPAFREEREIRLAHFCGIDRKAKKVLSLGARAPDGKRLSEPLKTHFRMSKGVLVPYVIVDYSDKGAVAPIKEIVLGPRNENAELNIEVFLNTIGGADVTVRRSKVPYRP